MFPKTIQICCFLFFALNAWAQDSVKIKSELSLDLKGQHVLAAFANNFDCFDCVTGLVRDNPFHHLAIYSGIDHILTINDNYKLITGLYLEERSYSHGNNTLSNLVLYPRIKLEATEEFYFFGNEVELNIVGGDFWDEDVDDILRFYNIDYHGLTSSLSYGNFIGSFMTIGDLSYNIGLDIEQIYRFSLGYDSGRIRNMSSLTYNSFFAQPRGEHLESEDFNISNYTRIRWNENFDLIGQMEVRINDALGTSVAAVIQGRYERKNLSISSALRYYQKEYNQGFQGSVPAYSGGTIGFTGRQLYPLRNYYRSLSQWAAYTHGLESDVIGLEIMLDWERQIYRKWHFFFQGEVNYHISLENDESLFFPVYNTGLNYKFASIFTGTVSATNKHMELFGEYQTFALSKLPFVSLGISVQLAPVQLKSGSIKY